MIKQALLIGIFLFPTAAIATPYQVLGDSLSAPLAIQGITAWPELLWDNTEVTNHAIGGLSTYDFLLACQLSSQPCWADSGDTSSVWLFYIGHNDPHRAEALGIFGPATGLGYYNRLRVLADIVQERTGAADFRLITSPYSWGGFGNRDVTEVQEWQDEMALYDQMLCTDDNRFTCTLDLRDKLIYPDHYIFDGVHQNATGQFVAALHIANTSIAPVPEPNSTLLMSSGLFVLGFLASCRPRGDRAVK